MPVTAQAADSSSLITAPVVGTIALLLLLVVGGIAWFTVRRRLSRPSAANRQLSSVLEFADCLLWQAKVELMGDDWKWDISLHPTGLSRRLFANRIAPERGGLWRQFDLPERKEMDARCRAALLAGKEGYEQQIHIVEDGRSIWLRESVSINRERPNQFWLVGLATDVTSRHEAEVARQASEERVRQLLSRADCLLWEAKVVAQEGGWFRWEWFIPDSELYRRISGNNATPGKVLWDPAKVPEHVEMDVRSRTALLEGRPSYEQEFRVLVDNAVLWMHEQVSVRAIGPGEWMLGGVASDITVKRRAEEAKRQSEAQLQRVLETAEFLLWHARVFLTPNGEMLWVTTVPRSQLYVRVFGREPDKADLLPWKEIVSLVQYDQMVKRADGAIASGATGYEQEIRGVRGENVFWLLEQATIRRISATEWHLVGILTDVTVRRRAEEAKRATEAQLQHILEMADCMVWQATVEEQPNDELYWTIFTPQSVLYRRLFGEGNWTGDLDWAGLTVPELPEMDARSQQAIREIQPGYEQEFRVLKTNRVLWLREVVTIVSHRPGHWKLVGVITDITAQREAQQAQRASVAQMEQLLASADCMLWQARVFEVADGGLRWVLFLPRSRLHRELFGRDPKDPVVLEWGEVVDPDTEQVIGERAKAAILSGNTGYEQEFRAQRGERAFWLNERASIAPVGPGEWELVGLITDLSARRAAEQAVQASEVRYRTLYQHTPVAIVEADFTDVEKWLETLRASGVTDLRAVLEADPAQVARWATHVRFLDCNDAALRIFKAKTKSDFRHRRGFLATIETLEVFRDAMLMIWKGGNTLEASLKMRDFAGGLREMSMRWWMGPTDRGVDLRQSVMVFVDLTELKQAEAALAAEKERLAVTLRAMAEGVITTDTDGRVQFMNQAAAAFTQWTPDEAIGRPVADVCVLANDRTGEALEVPVAPVARGDVLLELPSRTKLTARNGTSRLVDGCCAPIHSASSQVIGIVLVFRDVTEHERLEQELVRASKLESVGILAGGIAHDFNNILTAVMGNIALAALDVDRNSDAGISLREAEKATLRARDLTQQLLTFAKGGEPVRAAVQLDGIVREMTTFALHGSNVRAAYDVAPDLWPADADKGQIGRVVQNLVLNAVQAMPEGGTINIALKNEHVEGLTSAALVPGDYVQIAITDTGAGIKREHLSRIFDPYFTTKQTGSGLGLAAVYSIVSKHRGSIDVQSQPGKGSTFRIWLPATHVVSDDTGLQVKSVKMTALKGRVLFMDDEEAIRQMASFLLRRFGFDVVCAKDGSEAVQTFRAAKNAGEPFALVIMDLTVPGGMGGREAIPLLREIDPNVRAIVSSGYSSDPILANYRAHGFAGVAAKPYEMTEFARVLREVMAE